MAITQTVHQETPLCRRAGARVDADHRIAGLRVVGVRDGARRSGNLGLYRVPGIASSSSSGSSCSSGRRAASLSRASAVPRPIRARSRHVRSAGRKIALRPGAGRGRRSLDFRALGTASSGCTRAISPQLHVAGPPTPRATTPIRRMTSLRVGPPRDLAAGRRAATRPCGTRRRGPQGRLAPGPRWRYGSAGTCGWHTASSSGPGNPCLIRSSG